MKYSVTNHKATITLPKSEWEKIGKMAGWGHIIESQQRKYVRYNVIDTANGEIVSELEFPVDAQPGQNGYFYQEFFKDDNGVPKKEMKSLNGKFVAQLVDDGGLTNATTPQTK